VQLCKDLLIEQLLVEAVECDRIPFHHAKVDRVDRNRRLGGGEGGPQYMLVIYRKCNDIAYRFDLVYRNGIKRWQDVEVDLFI